MTVSRIKAALVDWGWLPGWLHVRWDRELRAEIMDSIFGPRDV